MRELFKQTETKNLWFMCKAFNKLPHEILELDKPWFEFIKTGLILDEERLLPPKSSLMTQDGINKMVDSFSKINEKLGITGADKFYNLYTKHKKE